MSEHEESQEYQQFMEQQQAMNESVSHELHLWVGEQSDVSLDKLGMMLHAAMRFPMWGAQMLGIIQGARQYKYGVCPVCGKNHDKEQQEIIEAEHARMTAEGTPIPGTPFRMGDAAAFDEHVANLVGKTYTEFLANCAKYRVRPMGDQTDAVYCRDCNMRYRDLEDRMVKEPDDCSGCNVWQSTGVKHPEPPKQ